MADLTIPAAPGSFRFGSQQLRGILASFSGSSQRRHAEHVFPKRAGGRVEDMNRASRRCEVVLEFIGDDCADQFQKFEAKLHDKPTDQLVHPIAGQFTAFCTGPLHEVDFGRALDEIKVRVAFIESELDAQVPRDVPDVSTQAQNTTAQQVATALEIAKFVAAMAKRALFSASSLTAIDQALDALPDSETPLDDMVATVQALPGLPASVLSSVTEVHGGFLLLDDQISAFVDASGDVFEGEPPVSGQATSLDTLLGQVQDRAQALELLLVAAPSSPAGAAEAVGSNDEALSECILLGQAVKASRPPLVSFVVSRLTDVVRLATELYPGDDPVVRAAEIMGLNRIPNPGAIPAGTVLLRYSR